MRFAAVLFSVAAVYGAPAGTLNVQDIIRKSVAATEADWKAAPRYAFLEHDIISKKDRSKTAKTYEVLMIDGSPYNKMTAIDGHPLSKAEQQAEDGKLQQEISKRNHESPRERARRIAKYQKERTQDVAMMLEMGDAFAYRLVAETKLDGHDVYEFEATPKPGYVPKTRETKVLVGMRGTLWVDKATYQWVKVQAEVIRPVSFYGFLAKVGPGTSFLLEQEPVAPNVWMPKHFAVKVRASALGFINEDSTDDETYRNYRPMTKALELQAMR